MQIWAATQEHYRLVWTQSYFKAILHFNCITWPFSLSHDLTQRSNRLVIILGLKNPNVLRLELGMPEILGILHETFLGHYGYVSGCQRKIWKDK